MTIPLLKPKALPSEFLYWSGHVIGCALPSLFIAIQLRFPPAPIVLGILTFILGFTLLTSSDFFQQRRHCLLGKIVRKGTKIRLWISLYSLPFVVVAQVGTIPLHLFTPDFWCGFIAYGILEECGLTSFAQKSHLGTYLLTLTEGLIMAGTLAFICLIHIIPITLKQPEGNPT